MIKKRLLGEKLNGDDVSKVFRKLKGQIIQKFSVKENADQHFHLVTDKIDLKFRANDLGIWIEKYKIRKAKEKTNLKFSVSKDKN